MRANITGVDVPAPAACTTPESYVAQSFGKASPKSQRIMAAIKETYPKEVRLERWALTGGREQHLGIIKNREQYAYKTPFEALEA